MSAQPKRARDPEETDDIIESIVALAQVRTETLREIQELRAEAVNSHAERRRELTDHHHRANNVLVQAVEAAVRRGVPRTEIFARLDISRARYYQIRERVAEREKQHRRDKANEMMEQA